MAGRRRVPPISELVETAARPDVLSLSDVAREHDLIPNTLHMWLQNHPEDGRAVNAALLSGQADSPISALVHALIKRKRTIRVEQIADELDTSPKQVRKALDVLREQGYRVPPETQTGEVTLEPVDPDINHVHRGLLEGDELTVGLVSDTHLCSSHEALGELHAAYDEFERRGITTVLHSGDLVAGCGIFKGQASELKVHTYEGQVDYAVEHYPRRDGIRTLMISGNHDLEGDFGKAGADPVRATAAQREDITYLGEYSAHVELPGGRFIHLLHGKGGMSYAVSYKAQKLVDGYPAGAKPAALFPGHWHVQGWWQARGVHCLFPGCFEWRSKFLTRLGLHPAVGFHVVTLRIADDGSVVGFIPEWMTFHPGRTLAAPLAA